jgi:dipeptidyl aminopeptidase/acylaminoacyl peptidase
MAQSQRFYELLTAKGVKAQFIKIPAVGHSFLGQSAETTRAASRMALHKTLDFIEATIGDQATH